MYMITMLLINVLIFPILRIGLEWIWFYGDVNLYIFIKAYSNKYEITNLICTADCIVNDLFAIDTVLKFTVYLFSSFECDFPRF